MKKKVVLMILDGWGHGDKTESDAIYNAKTPFIDGLMESQPSSELRTDGEHVGLPADQMGNSEVGHLNIGAGRIVYQDLAKINKAIESDDLSKNETLNNALNYAIENKKKLHFIGLVSNGGVHSSQEHLHKLCDIAERKGVDKYYIHAFTDGRDCNPKTGLKHIKNLKNHLSNTRGEIASIIGRYYAMDRDNRWERIKLAFDLLVNGKGEKYTDSIKAIEDSYTNDVTDEFIKPIVCVDQNNEPLATIQEDDVVICFNFRTDRCREITIALTQEPISDHKMSPLNLHYTTMTEYDKTFNDVNVIFRKDNLSMTLGEVVANKGRHQIRIAETEKYPHVTFFFSGGREIEFENERRIMVKSPKVATYDLQPEMSALEITEAIKKELEEQSADFICLNFANPDMVGHTGVYSAVIKAVETVDSCAQKVVETGVKNDYSFLIIADHGNADYVINKDGSPNTAHSTNPVPVILIDKDHQQIKSGILADVAPTILSLMDIEQPKEMTGKSLLA